MLKIDWLCAFLRQLLGTQDPAVFIVALNLAGGDAGDIGAAAVALTTGDRDVRPGPAGAGSAATGDDNVISGARDSAGSGNVLDDEVGDRNATGGVAVKVSTIVVLFDQDAILGDVLESDARVGDSADPSGLAS